MSADAQQEHPDRHRPAVHLNLETTLEKKFPDWFSGRKHKLARPITRGMNRWLGMDVANQILSDYNHLQGLSFIEAVLRQFDFRYLVDDVEVAQIPPRGRVIIAANHPLGGLDSFVLLKLIGDIRPDVKILANDILLRVEPIKELLLGVRIMGGKPSASTYRNIINALEQDQAVIVFPAGEVSRLSPRVYATGNGKPAFCASPPTPVRRFCQCTSRPTIRPGFTRSRRWHGRWVR